MEAEPSDTREAEPRSVQEPAGRDAAPTSSPQKGFSSDDVEEIEERSRLRAPMIYEILRREGEEEMDRPLTSLWWSGVAAGLSISFSLVAEAALRTHLPDAPWRPLITSLGYTVGFLTTVLSRQQLFTENTITPVLPVAADLTVRNLLRMGRLWSVVLVANFVGTLLAALFYSLTPALTPETRAAMLDLSRHLLESGPGVLFIKAIGAGFLIAAMVWLIPNVGAAQIHIIFLMTYLVAIADFAHIVVGSLEAFTLAISGQLAVWPMVSAILLPTLVGNIIGGTLLFALISYGQVAKEV